MKRFVLAVSTAVFLASCAQTPSAPPAPPPKLKDSELALPANYKTWSNSLVGVERADAKQIRDIYINTTKKGDKFANGTVAVMELHKAKANPDGTLAKDANGKLIKDGMLKVFVMGKGEGWGDSAPAGLKNGDWIYSAFLADGKPAPDPILACRTCHLPMGDAKDFLGRHAQYK
jgi:hypothetical protein